jgi:hypothetical protein
LPSGWRVTRSRSGISTWMDAAAIFHDWSKSREKMLLNQVALVLLAVWQLPKAYSRRKMELSLSTVMIRTGLLLLLLLVLLLFKIWTFLRVKSHVSMWAKTTD